MMARKLAWILPILLCCLLVGSVLAAGGEHGEKASPWDAWMLFWRVVNTAALIVLLGYLLKRPLSKFFSERTTGVQRELEEAKAEREKAEKLIKEYQQKIAGMAKELEKMREELRKAGETESEKLLANAERMSKGIVETARIAAEQEVRKARTQLQNESVDLAVKMAEAIIQQTINTNDHKRIVEDYLAKVEGMK